MEQAKKALHVLHWKIRNLYLSLDIQLNLFDYTSLPISLYDNGCEIWGFHNVQVIYNVHNQFLRKSQNYENVPSICYKQNLVDIPCL